MCQKTFRWLSFSSCECRFGLLLFCFGLNSCLSHLKGKCMTKMTKVWIANNQHLIILENVQALKLWTRIRKWILVFRCWHYKNKQTNSAEIVWGNKWNVYFEIVFVFKLSICVVAMSSLYSKLWFSPVTPHHSDPFKILIGNKMPKFERALLVLHLFTCKEYVEYRAPYGTILSFNLYWS